MNLHLVNLILLVLVYGMAGLATATRLLGIKIMDLNLIFPFEVMPPSITFMVSWTCIYIALGVLTRWLWTHRNDTKITIVLQLLVVSHIFHILRLITNGQQLFVLNVMTIVVMALVLIRILDYLIREKQYNNKYIPWVVTGIYYGWISIATVVLGTSQLMYLVFPGFALHPLWYALVVLFAILTTVWSWLRWHNIFALIVSLWAIAGVLFKLLF